MTRSVQIALSQLTPARDGWRDQRLTIARPSTQTASSTESAPRQCTAGVGQTFSNVSEASSTTSAATSTIHRLRVIERVAEPLAAWGSAGLQACQRPPGQP